MQKVDLYICEATQSERLRFIHIFDQNFSYEPTRVYAGYLGINVNRIKLISVISDLRAHKIECFSAPIKYRDHENISMPRALDIAKIHADKLNASAFELPQPYSNLPPVYWKFGLNKKDAKEERAGGIVMIDRIDGHIWSDMENEEYMYDYNNIF